MSREIRVLNVAEKPSVAREITKHLGGAGAERRQINGVHVAEFPYTLRQTRCQMVVTAVRGHLCGIDFEGTYQAWKGCQPGELFAAPIKQSVQKDCRDIEKALLQLARQCHWLVLWLDCDREGEAIAFEVLQLCQAAARNRLQVFRAVFSALTHTDLVRACETLRLPDQRLADAVNARQEIDLRAGAAFTRWMTLRYHAKFPELSEQPLSYGPCQFPTLGFVVERWLRIQRFVSEPFWSIRAEVARANQVVKFGWRRHRLFDRLAVQVFYELCAEVVDQGARVIRVSQEPKSKWRPAPLNTVELGKLAASRLRMAPARCMQVAEHLYQRGYISYPRTETDRFGPTIDVQGLVQAQRGHPEWGAHVASLLDAGRFTLPRAGSHDDHAHPPIHPVACAVQGGELIGEAWRIYEVVVRHFLACCSPDARGNRTEVDITLAEEVFTTAGLVVLDRGWLEVYPYANWVHDPLPTFVQNEVVSLSTLQMTDGRTQPPPLLSEADLIGLMDRTGIGTDATMHEHIAKIQQRKYAVKNEEGRLTPSRLGVALVEGYKSFAAEEGLDLSKPELRAEMERGMDDIAKGQRRKGDFLELTIAKTRRCYGSLERSAPTLDAALGMHFAGAAEQAMEAPVEVASISSCRCGSAMDLRCHRTLRAAAPSAGGAGRATGRGRGRGGGGGRSAGRAARGRAAAAPPLLSRFLVCQNEACHMVLPVPSKHEQSLRACRHICPICNFQVLTVRNQGTGKEHNLCPFCFNNVPRDLHPDQAELRCFQCCHPSCPLAGGQSGNRSAAPAGPSGGTGASGAGDAAARGYPVQAQAAVEGEVHLIAEGPQTMPQRDRRALPWARGAAGPGAPTAPLRASDALDF